MATPWQYAQIEARRDETFARVRRAFRWTVATALAGTAVIIGAVAHEIPGRSTVATAPGNGAGTPSTIPAPATATGPVTGTGAGGGTSVGGGTGSGTTAAGNGTGSAGAVAPPVSAPAPAQRAPTVVSGGTGW